MELSNRQVITLFPSYLFVGKIPDLTLCDRLDAALRAMKAANEASKQDELSFMTRDDIWKRREMKELVDLVLAESGKVLDFYKVKRDSHYIGCRAGKRRLLDPHAPEHIDTRLRPHRRPVHWIVRSAVTPTAST